MPRTVEELREQLRTTHKGMMEVAGSGPAGKTCRECREWMQQGWHAASNARHGPTLKPAPCAAYKRHTGVLGAAVPHEARACKHFHPNPAAPPRIDPNSRLL